MAKPGSPQSAIRWTALAVTSKSCSFVQMQNIMSNIESSRQCSKWLKVHCIHIVGWMCKKVIIYTHLGGSNLDIANKQEFQLGTNRQYGHFVCARAWGHARACVPVVVRVRWGFGISKCLLWCSLLFKNHTTAIRLNRFSGICQLCCTVLATWVGKLRGVDMPTWTNKRP